VVQILKSQNVQLDPVYKERVTLASGLPYISFFSLSFFLHQFYKAAIPCLRAWVTLGGGLTFFLVNTPGRVNLPTQVNFLLVSRPLVRIKLSQVIGLPYLNFAG